MTDEKSRRMSLAMARRPTLEEVVMEKCHHRTHWGSIWICIVLQFVIGIQISIYFMSMWPYLSKLDASARMHFLGWVVASCSIGCSVANPIFGYWNEKLLKKGERGSVTWPTIVGFVISAVGQVMYGLLPLLDNNIKWYMIGARFITGFGTGCLSVLRAYTATAALPKNRLSAISYGTAGWVLGISFGPAIQAMFTPVGRGWKVGFLLLNMYTLPAFFMSVLTLAACVFVIFFMEERYAGIIDASELDANKVVIPKYDVPPAIVCVWLWVVSCMIATNIEVISTPLSTAMYGWNDSTSILYNGIIESVTCIVSVFINFLIGYTRIGLIDKRKQVIFGLLVFLLYHIINYPWPFYSGPLDYIPAGLTSVEVGGCEPQYLWCATTTRIPLILYIFSFVVLFGMAFPFVGSPSASLYSEILGPRPQGMLQGMYSFGGSCAQFIAPIFATFLFHHTGYIWVIVTQIVTLTVALVLMIVYYHRLVPLDVVPRDGLKPINIESF